MTTNSTQPSTASLLGLPVELRQHIFHLLWRSLIIEVRRGPSRFNDMDDENITRCCKVSRRPSTPQEVASLRLACKKLNHEIDSGWHSQITYHFPTTVSFVDVLSQWSKEQVCQLRYAYVEDYPLPLYAHGEAGYFTTLDFSDVLPMFPGMELELLTVKNIWLESNGKPLDSWCFAATSGMMKRLLVSCGWRRLEYISGILPCTPSQMTQLDTAVERLRTEHAELDFRYGLGRVRPHTHSRGNLLDFNLPDEPMEQTVELVRQWYAEHGEERMVCDMDEYPEDVTESDVAMWAVRGAKADYVQSGYGLCETLRSFENKMTWLELRETDEYLVGDGTDDPTAFL